MELTQKLGRYEPIVADFDGFMASARQPLPRVIWANPLKRDIESIGADICTICPQATRLNWTENGWRLPSDAQPGRWLSHVIGEIFGQEEASMLAADMLDAQPGESILDMCAAPGGKSARIAVKMNDRGHLVANEKKHGRIGGLRWNLNRLGITCATVNHDDALRLKTPEVLFDRVLVDAPCSCEGTTRKSQSRDPLISAQERDTLTQVQVGLLRKAIELAKPGGRIIYSTCTYAPEENEGVLDRIDRSKVALEPLNIPEGFRVTPGITTWQEKAYREDVSHSARVWPHLNDTGGFFIAQLRRL